MKNTSKLNEANKFKNDQQVAVKSSLEEIRRVADTNQLRLQHLEQAIVKLTSICSAIRNDMQPMRKTSSGKLQDEVLDMKRRSSTTRSTLGLKSDVLGVQMQQLVEQAAVIGLFKDSKASSINLSGNKEANSKIPTRPAPKKVQATTNRKNTTKPSLVQSMESTTEKKTSMKQVKNSIGATQPKAKAPPVKGGNRNNKTSTIAKVSVNSTVKKTKTTIAKLTVNQSAAPNKSKEKTTAENVEKRKGKGSIKLTIKASYGQNKPHTAGKPFAVTKMNSSPTSGSKSDDLKPRRKWSMAEDTALAKY